ncbi:ead/Ea22-like family protein [Cronobacter sakazakii]|nr:ead/Ea22-like family protein [Cronobacter sakazakii]
MTDTAKLKAAAEKARWGDWSAYKPHSGARGYEVRVGSEAVAQHCLKDDAAFIAEASPKAVLELIAALEAAEKRNAELEARAVTLPVNDIGKAREFYESAVVVPLSVVKGACAAAGINLETGGEA